MFYYRITIVRGNSPQDEYREFLRPSDLGRAVAWTIAEAGCRAVTIRKISQADYIAATRQKD